MKLKRYQEQTIATLSGFFKEARLRGPAEAFQAITSEPDQARRLRGYAGRYKPVPGLPDVPYVCLRLPTGGGKTLLASHAIALARDHWMEKDYPVVVWLVPSDAIRRQTVEALKDARHPYRRSLDDAFEGRVRVFDIGDFTQATPQDLRANLCVQWCARSQRLSPPLPNTGGKEVTSNPHDFAQCSGWTESCGTDTLPMVSLGVRVPWAARGESCLRSLCHTGCGSPGVPFWGPALRLLWPPV